MNVCPSCKVCIDDEFSFCPRCGSAVSASVQNQPVIEEPLNSPSEPKYKLRQRNVGEWEIDKENIQKWLDEDRIHPMDEIFDPKTGMWTYAKNFSFYKRSQPIKRPGLSGGALFVLIVGAIILAVIILTLGL